MAKENETALSEFSFDTEVEFFGEKGTPDTIDLSDEEKAAAIKVKDDEKKAEVKETPKKKEEEEPDFFGVKAETTKTEKPAETKEPEDPKTEKKPEETEEEIIATEEEEAAELEKTNQFFTQLTTELIDTGVFGNVKLKKGESVSEERFFELQQSEIDTRIEEAFDTFADEMDDDGKAFLKFKKQGGKTSEFLSAVKKTSLKPEGNLDDEKHQARVVRYYYELEGSKDAEEIDDHIEWLKDGGKLESHAKKFDAKIEASAVREQKAILKAQDEADKKRKKAGVEFKDKMKSILTDADDISGFPITKKDRTELVTYTTRATEKRGKDQYITKFQKELTDALKDDNKLLILAKIVKDNFNFKSLEGKASTTEVKKIKSKLEHLKDGGSASPKSSGSSGKKSLSEFF